ncbi:MAG TPA: bacillithiol biosynthesis deacetylase BshB1 [Vicinamibacteria bacterium]|nr:bacillithiol biosynthesis deacetylase BshB1 [Vicinamibacteria bacterium]
MQVDALAFGPHPDDVELAMGGTLLKLSTLGYRTGIIDLTSGEMGTRGTPEGRAREAQEAARILHVSVRRCLDLGDGRLEASFPSKVAVVEAIREYRPRLVFTNYPENNHPDHAAAGPLVAEASYLAGLQKLEAKGEPHRPNRVLYYLVPRKVTPSFVVDVTAFHEEKMRAVRAHGSQLFDESSREPETYISRPGFLSRIESLDLYHGALIDVDFGEAFYVRESLEVDDPVRFFGRGFTRIT